MKTGYYESAQLADQNSENPSSLAYLVCQILTSEIGKN